MKKDTVYFHYERTRKQQATTIAINVLILPIIVWVLTCLVLYKNSLATSSLILIAVVTGIVEAILLSIMLWMLFHPASFVIKLTSSEFSSHHPLFDKWTFSINPIDIIEIKHRTDREGQDRYIEVKTKNGSTFYLSPNFSYNRKQLYTALKQVNPAIKTPSHTWLFTYD